MARDLHITRAEKWFENAGHEISAEEWMDIVRSDPGLMVHPINGPHFAIWIEPGRGPHGWIDWSGGNLWAAQADRALLEKMQEIAERLGAKVQGDDGTEAR